MIEGEIVAEQDPDPLGLPKVHILIPAPLDDGPESTRTPEEAFAHNAGKDLYAQEMRRFCEAAGFQSVLHMLTMNNRFEVLASIPKDELCFNLCDGCDEIDSVPGSSVADYLEVHNYKRAGCSACFTRNTTIKAYMKDMFIKNSVSTPSFVSCTEWSEEVSARVSELTFPLLVKLGDAYGSVGLTPESVVHSTEEAHAQLDRMVKQFPGHQFVVEEFIDGPEYSVVVFGGDFSEVVVYPPAQRVFDDSVPLSQRFLTYALVWVEYGIRYNYAAVPAFQEAEIMALAKSAYVAVQGSGYGRVDIRRRASTDELFVLEVNAMCGIGTDSSSDCILKLSRNTTCDFIKRVLLRHPPAPLHDESERRERMQEAMEAEAMARADVISTAAAAEAAVPMVLLGDGSGCAVAARAEENVDAVAVSEVKANM